MNTINPFEVIDKRLSNIEALLTSLKHPEKLLQEPPTAKYFNTPEAAAFLSKSENAIRVMVCKNQINSIKKGKSLYFRESDLIEYLESGRRQTAKEIVKDLEDILATRRGGKK